MTPRKLDQWIIRHISSDLSVAALAERARMAPRSFARAYPRLAGTTPAKAVEKLRLSAAARLLSKFPEAPLSLKRVAHACGFGSPANLRRAFQRQWGFSPTLWREAVREAAVTEEERNDLLDTIDKRLLCLQINLDRQTALVIATLSEQLDRIEILVGGTPPVEPSPEPIDAP